MRALRQFFHVFMRVACTTITTTGQKQNKEPAATTMTRMIVKVWQQQLQWMAKSSAWQRQSHTHTNESTRIKYVCAYALVFVPVFIA